MKCPADLVTACDKEPECKCGFCKDHCICEEMAEMDEEEIKQRQMADEEGMKKAEEAIELMYGAEALSEMKKYKEVLTQIDDKVKEISKLILVIDEGYRLSEITTAIISLISYSIKGTDEYKKIISMLVMLPMCTKDIMKELDTFRTLRKDLENEK